MAHKDWYECKGRILTKISIAVVRYGVGILKKKRGEAKEMNRKSRKLLMHGTHHMRADTYWLYMKRANEGRRLLSMENCVRIELRSLIIYLA